MDISNIVLLTVVCLTSVHIQGILGVCNSTETPAINLCEDNTLTVQKGSRIYLDSASAAPAFQRIQCTCTLSFAGSGSLNIEYRVQNNDPALTDCGVQLNFSDQTWGCVSQSLTAGHQGINNITYIKKFNGTANWYSCLGISSNFYSINLQCFPSRRYYLPDEVVNGGFSDWEALSECSVTCGTGTQEWVRRCNNPAPMNNGTECLAQDGTRTLEETETRPCNLSACPVGPVDGGFTEWSTWTTCTQTCGGGSRERSRSCTNPSPQNGGLDCTGSTSQSEECNINTCPAGPVDGGFTDWTTWTTCTQTCGGGNRERSRTCTDPPPQNGGLDCTGSTSETEQCNLDACPGSGTTGGTTASPAQFGESTEKDDTSLIWAVVGGIIGGLLFLLLLILLICCICRRRRRKEIDNTRRPSTGPRSVRYLSHGDDVTVTENELYHYDGETPSHATNALFIGGIPETPNSPGHIPHISVGTGDSYAVIMDSNRSKPKGKERPTLDTFNSREDKGNTEANGDVRASTDTVKLSENYNEPDIGRGVENPAYDENYIAPYDSTDGETQPKTSTSSPSPYDYIDNEKLKRDDAEFENEKLAGDYATLPDDIDDKTDADEDNDRYKRFISSEPEESPDDGYMKSPKRDRTFEFPDSS